MNTSSSEQDEEEITTQAAEWVVRLSAEDVTEAEGLAFLAWIEQHPAGSADRRRQAFDRAQGLWLAADGLAVARATPRRRRSTAGARRMGRPALAAAAAAAVGLAALPAVWMLHTHKVLTRPQATQTFATAAGERRSLSLPGGVQVQMDGATQLSATTTPNGRGEAALVTGEATFSVAHDPAHPFAVRLGAARVEDVGTTFDVVRTPGRSAVSVAQGEVRFVTDDADVRVPAGRTAALERSRLVQAAIDPADVGAWREGRRLYWDQPLGVVLSDLNRAYPQPFRLGDPAARRLRFTGVLVLGPQTDVTRRLTALLPLRARRGADGAVVLTSKDPAN